MLKIYPKIGSNLISLPEVVDYVEDNGIEIQLLKESENIIPIISKLLITLPNLREITIHAPIQFIFIEDIISSEEGVVDLMGVLSKCILLSAMYNIRINYLLHCDTRYELIVRNQRKSVLQKICNTLNGTEVYILLENDVSRIDEYSRVEAASEVVSCIDHPHLRMCLDVCHVHCVATLLRKDNLIEFAHSYFRGMHMDKIVHQVHFSHAENNDGILDKSTHSNAHPDLDALSKDIEFLKALGITSTNLITEVIEPKSYEEFTENRKELKLLKEYLKR